jgi:hypothetical protein
MGAIAAAVCIALLMAWRAFGAHEHSPIALPKAPAIPMSGWPSGTWR